MIFLSIIGCSPKITLLPAIETKELGHQLNQNYTSEIGDNVIECVKGKVYPAIIIGEDNSFSFGYGTQNIKKGDVFLGKAEMAGYNLFYPQEQSRGAVVLAVNKADGTVRIYNENSDRFYKSENVITYLKTDKPDPGQNYFKQQFIYNGKSGSAIKFTYREFSNDLARPAFTQDLIYDLNEGNTIGFKGMRIEISKATNIDITYKIVKGFE